MAPPRVGVAEQPMLQHRRVADGDASPVNLPNDIAGYFGNDGGEVLAVPAGAAVVFSALTLHGSGDNKTDRPRRALNLAFGQGAPAAAGRPGHANTAVPFLAGGEVVRSAEVLRQQAAACRGVGAAKL